MVNTDNGTIQYRNELARKSIHLTSLLIPIIYYFISKPLALYILVPMALISLVSDTARIFIKPVRDFFNQYFGFMLRQHEKDENNRNLSGATYVLLSAVVCLFLFPKAIFISSFSILIISDTCAALFGRKFGKHKFLAKSFEGSLAFFVSAILVVLISPQINVTFGIIAAFIATLGENLSYGWADDNFVIPISAGSVMWCLYHFLQVQIPTI